MSEVTLDDRGRLTLPKDFPKQYGDHYRLVEVHNGTKLIPVADDPLQALRDEFAAVDKSADTLRTAARDAALDQASQ